MLVWVFIFYFLLPGWASATTFSINGRELLLDGERFFAKGVNYSPVPPGCDITEADGSGDMLTDDWATVYDRDLAYLRAACINTIRVYNWIPDEDVSHLDFLDKAWNGGEDPVFVWITSAFAVDSWTIGPFEISENLRKIATKYGGHDAVIGFVLGNELNNGDNQFNPDFWTFINSLGGIVKQVAPGKLTLSTLVDDSMETVTFAETQSLSNLDVWGINSYRGSTTEGFDILFSSFAELSDKPLLISEFGVPASTRNSRGQVVLLPNRAELQADYMEVHYEDCLANSEICQGGFVFEWTDEWWKSPEGTVSTHDASPHENEAFPGGWWDEEWFGMHGVEPMGNVDTCDRNRGDILHPRDVYYRYAFMEAIGSTCVPDPIEDDDPPFYTTTSVGGDGGDDQDGEDGSEDGEGDPADGDGHTDGNASAASSLATIRESLW